MLETKGENQGQIDDDAAAQARAQEVLALDTFLASLAVDKDQAWARYEHLRNAVIRFAERGRAPDPHSCADEVLRILQKQIAEGEEIEHIEFYVIGIARNVLRRDTERRNKRELELPEWESENVQAEADSPLKILEEKDEARQRKKCLAECLRVLPALERELLEKHGLGSEHHQSERALLAEWLNISPGNLRVKVFRIKQKLKQCLAECLEKSSGKL